MTSAGCGVPLSDDHCRIEPSAETETTLSVAVHLTPHTASVCAVEKQRSVKCRPQTRDVNGRRTL